MSSDVVVTQLRAAGCVFAEEEAQLLLAEADSSDTLSSWIRRRTLGEPLEQVLGWVEFCGLRISLERGVFVPRARSEFLVHLATAFAEPGMLAVDLCCGSGALGAGLTAAVRMIELHASDLDPVAVACARRNLPGATVYQGDLYDALPRALRGRVDLLLANVPYVPTAAIALLPREARLHEPHYALDGGPDGLDVARRLAADAALWLAPGGRVLFEADENQAVKAAEILDTAGLSATTAPNPDANTVVAIGAAT